MKQKTNRSKQKKFEVEEMYLERKRLVKGKREKYEREEARTRRRRENNPVGQGHSQRSRP